MHIATVDISRNGFDGGVVFTGLSGNVFTAPHAAGQLDFNGDGFTDFVLANEYADGVGGFFIVFGDNPDVISGAVLYASTTASVEVSGFAAGFLAVDSIGDFNGDGFDDLFVTATSDECSFILFGRADEIPETPVPLATGDFRTSLNVGETVRLELSDLSYADDRAAIDDITLTVSDVVAGRLFRAGAEETDIQSFTMRDIFNGEVFFAHDGINAPGARFSVTAENDRGA